MYIYAKESKERNMQYGTPNNTFLINFREPLTGGQRQTCIYDKTLIGAVAQFNSNPHTSGFDTPMRVQAFKGEVNWPLTGKATHIGTFTLQGRYGVPQQV